MKKLLKIIGFIFLGFIGLGIIGALFSDEDTSKSTTADASTVEASPVTEISAEEKAKEIETKKTQLASIKKSFNYKEDEFSGNGWYSHKVWKNSFKTGLKAHVNKNGFVYLESYYTADDWLFHDQITVKIGDNQVITSEVIPTYDENNVRDHSSGTIWETVSYLNGKDNGILERVADYPEETIKVRFIGKTYKHDMTLSKTDKLALAECVRLSQLIKEAKQLGI